ncbi:MAG: hypothetical protein WD801_09300 [Gemmatimonadaceae bacterium]
MVQLPSLFILALVMQGKPGEQRRVDRGDTARHVIVSVTQNREREPRRTPVTAEHLRTAFGSPAARTLLMRARASRLSQDSALMSYDATTYLRISAGLGFSRIGRDRLIFRHENTTRVRWHRDAGAWIDVKGARTVIPIDPDPESTERSSLDSDFTPVPYYPGQEPLLTFFGGYAAARQVNEREIIHPLAEGAEAYYTYAAGDSVGFRLPEGRTIQLRALEVRPRESRWNVAVGTLWFEASSGQLVRAAFRLAVPMDIWAVVREEDPTADEDIPPWVKPLISPMRMQVRAIAVEYGLHEGRFWLPRMRSAEAELQISFARAPARFEQRFQYASVNTIESLPEIMGPPVVAPPDSLTFDEREQWRDSVLAERRHQRRAVADSVERGLRERRTPCDSLGMRTHTRVASGSNLRVAVVVPCDARVLANSPDLPKSIYDEGEEIFSSADRDALVKEALAMGAQPPFALGAIPPTLKWGLEFTRFNRVEGFSAGALIEQRLGAGYTASLLARLGHADLEPNAELTLARTNLTTTVSGRAYNRLVSANDWGNPLSVGSSLSALLFGRDEGFYYRASGAEIEWLREGRGGALWSTRAFAERQRTAAVDNEFSFGAPFIANIGARAGAYAGFATRVRHARGLDPNGFRVFTDLRLEGAVSDSAGSPFGRGAVDLTVTQGVGRIAAAVTVAGGASAGVVPMQRRWYLGGAHTVRGQRPDTSQSGNALWLGRVEVGGPVRAVRPVLFGDIGWAGERDAWRDAGRPMSGAGVGASVLDGLLRLDVSRGVYPGTGVRIDLYVDARF